MAASGEIVLKVLVVRFTNLAAMWGEGASPVRAAQHDTHTHTHSAHPKHGAPFSPMPDSSATPRRGRRPSLSGRSRTPSLTCTSRPLASTSTSASLRSTGRVSPCSFGISRVRRSGSSFFARVSPLWCAELRPPPPHPLFRPRRPSFARTGQDRFGALYRIYYRDAFGAMLVFDLSRQETFHSVLKVHHEALWRLCQSRRRPSPPRPVPAPEIPASFFSVEARD